MYSKNLKHPRTISTIVEDEIYKQFADTLPRSKSVAEALREHMKSVVDESKKVEALERLPILAEVHSRQTTISEYDIKFFQPYPERINNLRNLSKEQQTKLQIDLNHMQQEIKLVRKY
jgi:S-ribosylhomocysteine lyase LuxS involved in autoinducer biosynthesis